MKRRTYTAGVIALVLLIYVVTFAQTSKKITELNALTTPTSDDLLLMVDSPASSAESKKITLANFQAAIQVPGANITGSGTLADAVLSSNIPRKNTANTFTATQTGPLSDKGGEVFNVQAYGAV